MKMKYIYRMLIGFGLALVTMFFTEWIGLGGFLQGAYTIAAYNAAMTFPKQDQTK